MEKRVDMRRQMDYWLYPLMGVLGAIPATSAPQWAKELSAVILAGAVALKAKRSGNGRVDSEPTPQAVSPRDDSQGAEVRK